MTHSWNNIPGKFEIEIAKDEIDIVRLSNDAIIPVESFANYLLPFDLHYLAIHWRSRGSHTKGRMHGDEWDWPPFHQDTRTLDFAEVRLAGSTKATRLPHELASQLFAHFTEDIDNQPLPALD